MPLTDATKERSGPINCRECGRPTWSESGFCTKCRKNAEVLDSRASSAQVEPVYSVQFQLQEAELIALVEEIVRKFHQSPRSLGRFVATVGIIPLLPYVYFIIGGTFAQPPVLYGWVTMTVICIWVSVYELRWRRRYYQKWIRSSDARRSLEPMAIRLSPDRIEYETAMAKTSRSWRSIKRVEKRRDQLLIWSGDYEAFSVPARAFGRSHQFEAFCDIAEACFESMQANPRACPKCQYVLEGTPTFGCPECGWARLESENSTRGPTS